MSPAGVSTPLEPRNPSEWRSDRAWERRLASDRARAARHQSAAQQRTTDEVLRRSLAVGAIAFALTGSTARNRRTAISDLDYHVVGLRPRCDDLPGDVDVYVTSPERFWEKLRRGDDMVQWTLRFGCILDDRHDIFRRGLEAVDREGLWPNPERHLARLSGISALARQLTEMGDEDAALDQLRAALTARARASLLIAGVFPLARGELPEQLERIGERELAAALRDCIHSRPGLERLSSYLGLLQPPSRVKRASNGPRRTGATTTG